jgi:putative methyltransferase (TIGR04325 family)
MNFIMEWFLPPKIKVWVRVLLSRLVGFTKVGSWESAVAKSSGYESANVVEPIVAAAKRIQDDTQASNFLTTRYQQIATGMLYCISQGRLNSGEPIRVLDVGGGGADYFNQFQKFAPHINFDWTVLETPALAEAMSNEFGRNLTNLRWVSSIENTNETYDVILCSSVFQYVEKPFELLATLVKKSGFLIVNRISLVDSSEHFVAMQRIITNGKRASYPVHFFAEKKFLNEMSQYGDVQMRWLVVEDQPVINKKAQTNHGLVLRVNCFIIGVIAQCHEYFDFDITQTGVTSFA